MYLKYVMRIARKDVSLSVPFIPHTKIPEKLHRLAREFGELRLPVAATGVR
jgi:hypothetical protein